MVIKSVWYADAGILHIKRMKMFIVLIIDHLVHTFKEKAISAMRAKLEMAKICLFQMGKKINIVWGSLNSKKNTPGGKISANCKLQFKVHDTENDVIFTVTTTLCQINGEDCVNFCGLLRKHELYCMDNPMTFGSFTQLCTFSSCIKIRINKFELLIFMITINKAKIGYKLYNAIYVHRILKIGNSLTKTLWRYM